MRGRVGVEVRRVCVAARGSLGSNSDPLRTGGGAGQGQVGGEDVFDREA